MASAQLAIFKVPDVDNEPMVEQFPLFHGFGLTHLSEAMARDPRNARGLKRLWLKWRKSCPSMFLASLTESPWVVSPAFPLTVVNYGLVPIRSSPAGLLNNQFRLITRDTSVITMRRTRRLSAMLLTVPLLQRRSGRPSPGTIERLFSLKLQSWLAESIGTGSWPLQCSDRERTPGKLRSMPPQR